MREGRRSRSGFDHRMWWPCLLLLFTAGCVRGCTSGRPPIHIVPNMDDQPKYQAQGASGFFYDGKVMQDPVPGTVARGELKEDSAFYEGKDEEGTPVAAIPVPVDEAMLKRGKERFEIYCAPCHDSRGTGKGILFERGNVPTTSLHDTKVLDATDGYLFDIITHALGMMPSYGYPIPAEDRWAIIAHVRRLQETQAPLKK